MLRRTSEYTFRFSPKQATHRAALAHLDAALERLSHVTEPGQLSGSGASGPTAFVQFRVRGDEEAQRIARALMRPSLGTAVLTTGHGVNYRHLSI